MSSLPPGPPPAGPPPAGPPSFGPPGAETLERGGGGRIPPPDRPRTSGGGRKKLFLIGGAVIGLGAVGAAAFGAYWYLTTGPQPAEALPAGTLGYVSVDLDPSGGQKLDALRTLKKFPAADDELDLSGDLADIDVTEVLVEAILQTAPCDLDYGDDIEPWIGDRGAVAAVDLGEDEPAAVFVLQVTDADAAKAGVEELFSCGGGDESELPGTEVVDGQWLVVAETPKIVGQVVDATEKASLADDETFQEWTDAAGDPGIVSMYAAPAAGAFLADNLEGLIGLGSELGGTASGSLSSCAIPEPPMPEESMSPEELDEYFSDLGDVECEDSIETEPMVPSELDEMSDELSSTLQDFKGTAVTVRFDDGAIEVEVAGDPGVLGDSVYGDSGAEAIASLPDDTVAAFGLAFEDGWFDEVLAEAASSFGEDAETLVQEFEDETGLSLPEDAETLLGDSAALAVGGDFDPESFFDSPDPADVPIALKVLGDPDAVEGVLDDIRPQLGADDDLIGSSSEGDAIVIGPSEAYRDEVLGDGDLGGSDSFQSVVPDGDDVSAVLFLDLDRVVGLIVEGMGDDDELAANLDPLDALGMSAWSTDGVSHARLRISTD